MSMRTDEELSELTDKISKKVIDDLKNEGLFKKEKITKEKINQVEDRNERLRLIKENMDLYS